MNPPSTAERLARLMEQAKLLPPPTEEERQLQRLDFAYGNLACSTNHKPDIEAFWAVAQQRGVSKDAFVKWAAGKRWWAR